MKTIRVSRVLPLLTMLVTLALAGCNGPTPQNSESQEETEATKQVSVQVGTSNEVTMDIPEAWDVDTSNSFANITPDDFDGMIQLGVSISPMNAMASDEELLTEWQKSDTSVTGDWQKVSAENDVAPIYESSAEMEGGKDAKGSYALSSRATMPSL